MSGKFIVFEGPDGAGKTTQLALLAGALGGAVCEREPTGGEIGKQIRRALGGEVDCDPATLALLFAADRVEHVRALERELADGKTVLCDRYVFSSVAYQGLSLDPEWVAAINRRAVERLLPDAVVYIDLDEKTCVERIARGRDHAEIFETAERIARVRQNYESAFRMFGVEPLRFDGAKPAGELSREILAALRSGGLV